MSTFKSSSLGAIDSPLNILKEVLRVFNKADKCKTAIISFFDSKNFYIEWVRMTFEDLALSLGYCRATIAKHVKQLIEAGILECRPSHRFPKDTANEYKINSDVLIESINHQSPQTAGNLERCEKTIAHPSDSDRASDQNLPTYINQFKANSKISLSEGEREDVKPPIKTRAEERYPTTPSSETKPSTENNSIHECQSSAASSKIRKKRTNEEARDRDLYVWEGQIGKPYPVFLAWRADSHYKPQGGKWESGAYDFAYSEFYNNPDRATNALYPQFLAYVDTIAKNCNQLQSADIQAALPSCFVAMPEPTLENSKTLMGNVAALVERGAEVVVPSNVPTSQTISFEEAQNQEIKPLVKLQAIEPQQIGRQLNACSSQSEKIDLLNNYLQSDDAMLRVEAGKIAIARKFKVQKDENWEVVKVVNCLPPSDTKVDEGEKMQVDWDAIPEGIAKRIASRLEAEEKELIADIWFEGGD